MLDELHTLDALRIEPAGERHRDAVVALMREASAGCFCRFWHFEGDDNTWQARCNREPEDNRRELESALGAARGGSPRDHIGLVALRGGEAVGWLKLCPAAAIDAKLRTRRLYRSMRCFDGARDGVFVVGCMLVRPDARRQGVARALVRASAAAVRAWGGTSIEALPRVPGATTRDDELWTGPVPLFLEAGFVRVDGPDAYPVLRLELGDDAAALGEGEACAR